MSDANGFVGAKPDEGERRCHACVGAVTVESVAGNPTKDVKTSSFWLAF